MEMKTQNEGKVHAGFRKCNFLTWNLYREKGN